MSEDYRPHVIKQGDYLTKLAFNHGFDAEEAWNHEKNEEIRALRASMEMLAPGDVVHLPVAPKEGLPFTAGTTNRYRAKIPGVEVGLVFLDTDGSPMAGEPYTIEGAGAAAAGTSDDSGKVTVRVPVTTREVTILFPDRNLAHLVRIGDLDPPGEESGARQRLAHLGFLSSDAEAGDTGALAEAIRLFQVSRQLPETGAIDEDTIRALAEEHGA